MEVQDAVRNCVQHLTGYQLTKVREQPQRCAKRGDRLLRRRVTRSFYLEEWQIVFACPRRHRRLNERSASTSWARHSCNDADNALFVVSA
jgi:hypothetical protein